jgi:hypothetical protein
MQPSRGRRATRISAPPASAACSARWDGKRSSVPRCSARRPVEGDWAAFCSGSHFKPPPRSSLPSSPAIVPRYTAFRRLAGGVGFGGGRATGLRTSERSRSGQRSLTILNVRSVGVSVIVRWSAIRSSLRGVMGRFGAPLMRKRIFPCGVFASRLSQAARNQCLLLEDLLHQGLARITPTARSG